MTNTYSVLNSIAAAGADITLVGRKLNVAITPSTGSGTFPTIDYIFINSGVVIPSAAEVLQVSSLAYTFANNTTYKFDITQTVNGVLKSATITYTSDANATGAEIANALVAQINAHTELAITASGAATPLTLTAKAGNPIFTVADISNTTTTVTTPGVVSKGIGANLAASGIVGALAGNNYTQYVFTYGTDAGTQMATFTINGANVHTLYANEGDADFAAFNTRMGRVLNATDFATGAVANPEAVSVQ